MNSKNIAIGLAVVALSTISIAPAASAVLITGIDRPTYLAISGNDLFSYSLSGSHKYDATTGTLLDSTAFATGFNVGLEAEGNYLYASYGYGSNSVYKYDVSTGALVATLPISLGVGQGLAVAGNTLYVTTSPGLRISTYNATTGAVINPNFLTGLPYYPKAMQIVGNDLYIAGGSSSSGRVAKYNATTGAVINSSLISGVTNPIDLAIDGNRLFVSTFTGNTVAEYDAITGSLINSSVMAGLITPTGLEIGNNNLYIASRGVGSGRIQTYALSSTAVPEPFTIIGTIVGGTAALRMRKKLKSVTIDSASDDV